ncbi:MAG: glycosyltransferase family 4 protein [Bacteroidales bacterium]|nr:glycosyltransferase family 4 protein [Bacteroidales bacterium]
MDALNKEIIFFLPDSDAGVASIVRNVLKYRISSKIVYKVIFYHQKGSSKNRITDKYNVAEQIHFEFNQKDNLFVIFNQLKKYISSEKTILIANDIMALRLVSGLKLKNPLVYIIHGDFDYYYRIATQYQAIIDKFITYSTFIYQTLKLKLSTENRTKVELLYYPVPNIQNFEKKTNEILNIVFVGSLTERKGVQFFKQIIDNLRKLKVNFIFQIIGSGEKQNILKTQFQNYQNVIFSGQLANKDVLKALRKSDVFILPSLSEGLPNVVVEAMKNKCVPVTFDIPSGIPDLIDNGETGYKIELNNTTEFANKIAKLYYNKSMLLTIAENAYKKASKLFNENQASQYEEALLNIIINSNKIYPNKSLGRLLHKRYIPNFLVKFIRTIFKNPKI